MFQTKHISRCRLESILYGEQFHQDNSVLGDFIEKGEMPHLFFSRMKILNLVIVNGVEKRACIWHVV